jgi:hypothetical protein
MNPVNNITNKTESSNILFETIKRKPLKSVLLISAIVATVALAILLSVFAAPALPIAATIVYAAIIAAVPIALLCDEISTSMFARYKQHRTLEKVSNSDLVLVLEASYDHNGSFSINQKSRFKKLEKMHQVAFKKVSNIDDIKESIIQARAQNNRIKSIWIRAHGCPQGMLLGKEHSLDINNVHLLRDQLSQLSPNTSIVLDSCSTAGKNPTGQRNIAQRIATYARGCDVFGATRDTSPFSIKMNKKNPLKVEFWTGHKSSKNPILKYPLKFLNGMKEMFFHATNKRSCFSKLAYNATKVYRFV